MKKNYKWQFVFGVTLIFASAFMYYIHYVLFHDAHHIFIYLLGDIAFVPFEVLLVTLILHKVLEVREKRLMLRKMNMVIGAFFSEIGNRLIIETSCTAANIDSISSELIVKPSWSNIHYKILLKRLKQFSYVIETNAKQLEALKTMLVEKRSFLLGLLENSNLLEHEHFTDLLWAVFHFTEELELRKNLKNMPQQDHDHINNDLKRVFTLLLEQWVMYLQHLQQEYPYLFSLAIRTNPFDINAKVEIL